MGAGVATGGSGCAETIAADRSFSEVSVAAFAWMDSMSYGSETGAGAANAAGSSGSGSAAAGAYSPSS